MDAGATEAVVAAFWAALDDGQVSAEEFAGKHSLTAQRYYALLCNAFSSGPEGYSWIADEGLPSLRPGRPCGWKQGRELGPRFMEPWAKTTGLGPPSHAEARRTSG